MADRIDSNCTFQWVRVDRLTIPDEYQRARVESTIRKVREELDPDALGALLVSRRDDGTLAVIDGQQRHTGLVEQGYGDQQTKCLVYTGLSVGDEAALFVKFNKDRTSPRAMVIHNADVLAGDPIAVDLTEIAKARGLRFGEGTTPGVVQAVTTARDVYVHGSPIALRRTFDTIVRAWGTQPEALGGEIIRALGAIFSRYGRACDENRMARQLSKEPPAILLKLARVEHAERRGGTQGDGRIAGSVARMMLRHYNKGLPAAKRLEWDTTKTGAAWWKGDTR